VRPLLGGERCATRIEVVNLKVNMPHGRPRCKWGDTIKMDLKERGYGGVVWINLVQGRI
jgi:hypothetical protein